MKWFVQHLPLVSLLVACSLYSGTPKTYPILDASVTRYVGSKTNGYALSSEKGFLYYHRSLGGWFPRNEGLPQKLIYPFQTPRQRPLSAIGLSASNDALVAVSDGQTVFLSSDSGISWTSFINRGDFDPLLFITAVYPLSESAFLMGTGGTGLFYGERSGNTLWWRRWSRRDAPFYYGAGYYEQLAAFWVDEESDLLFASFDFGGGIYTASFSEAKKGRFKWERLSTPFSQTVTAFCVENSELNCFTRNYVWCFHLPTRRWQPQPDELRREMPRLSPDAQHRHALASGKRGIYIRWDRAAKETAFNELLDVIQKQSYNALVVDLKNDNGRLTYASDNAVAKAIGAVHPVIDLPALIKAAHEKGIYVIARMVVFKDPCFYRYQNGDYAIWDATTGKGWGQFETVTDEATGEKRTYQKEYWVDPFAQAVWDYNVQIALEIQSFGVDEIQFDYIRFPSDGPLRQAIFRHRQKGMSRMDALESFLAYARSKIDLPISTDLYGFQSYFLMGNHIGQNIRCFSRYVDVISPMFYPSHFPLRFMPADDYHRRAKSLYQSGCSRALQLTGGKTIIRPYVQAFMMPNERSRDDIDYRLYLQEQLKGVEAGHGSGFILWNNTNQYYMLD